MDLADMVIQANEQGVVEKQSGDGAPDGFYTDDLGFWVEQDIRKHKVRFAKYILFRCKYLNSDIHVRNTNILHHGYQVVECSANDIASLADLPEVISSPIAIWVYKRLLNDSPHLDRHKIEISPGWIWDVDKCVIIKIKDE